MAKIDIDHLVLSRVTGRVRGGLENLRVADTNFCTDGWAVFFGRLRDRRLPNLGQFAFEALNDHRVRLTILATSPRAEELWSRARAAVERNRSPQMRSSRYLSYRGSVGETRLALDVLADETKCKRLEYGMR